MTTGYFTGSLGTLRSDRLTAEGLPDLLTVEEAAALLRIGRNQAYELTRQWRATDGQTGIPVIELGRHSLRVPRHALERQFGVRFTAWPAAPAPEVPAPGSEPESESDPSHPGGRAAGPPPGDRPAGKAGASNVTPMRRRHPGAEPDQLALFQSANSPPEGR